MSHTVRWLSDDEQGSWRAYLRASRMLDVALDADLRARGIQLREYEILSMLSEAPGHAMRMSELADLVVQSRSRLTHTASRLEERGLVTRTPFAGDRRGVLLSLTPTGEEHILALAPVHVESVRRHLVDLLGERDFAELGRLMVTLADGLGPWRAWP